MTYTNAILFLLGVFGILTHCLVDINKINHQPTSNTTVGKYFKVEWAAILLSFIVVIVGVIVKQEIVELENAGKWIGIGVFGLGFAANSIITGFSNKAERFIDKNISNDATPSKPEDKA